MKLHMRLILLCVPLIMLQGCVGSTMISTAAFATKTINDPRTIGTQIDDNILEARVTYELFKNKLLNKKTHIINVAYQGNVLLLGQAPNMIINRAEKIVLNMHGINKVYNRIREGHPLSIKQMSLDAWITTKIRSLFLINGLSNSSNIKIITENREVFLLGFTTKQDSQKMINIVSKVKGVKLVDNTLIFNL